MAKTVQKVITVTPGSITELPDIPYLICLTAVNAVVDGEDVKIDYERHNMMEKVYAKNYRDTFFYDETLNAYIGATLYENRGLITYTIVPEDNTTTVINSFDITIDYKGDVDSSEKEEDE